MLDSRVAKGAHGKGRSSAKALRPPVCRGCAYTIAGGLYPAYGFAPTRLNTADAPTRDRSLPASAVHSIIDFLSARQISELHAHQFSRAAAGWIRLYILATFCLCPGERCQPDSATHSFGFWIFLVSVILFLVLGFVLITVPKPSPSWIWTSHLASRGEGCRGRFQHSARRGCFRIFQGLVICSLVCHAHAMPLAPHGAEEAARAVRRSGTVLQADRVVPSKRGTGVRCC